MNSLSLLHRAMQGMVKVGRRRRDYSMTLPREVSEYCLQLQDRCGARYQGRPLEDSAAGWHVGDDEETMALPARMQERKGKGHSSSRSRSKASKWAPKLLLTTLTLRGSNAGERNTMQRFATGW